MNKSKSKFERVGTFGHVTSPFLSAEDVKNPLLAIEIALQRLTAREKLLANAIKSLNLKRPICLVDVGSAKGITTRWKIIKDQVYVYGFEPDTKARDKLPQNTNFLSGGNIDFAYALSDKTEQIKLNILKKPSHSSALEPNYDLINRYPLRHPEGFELDTKVTVDACRLDELNLEAKDFMKIDVQGYELKVLKGAESSLQDFLGVEVEIEFFEMYRNQCTFGEITEYLLENNFEFIDFTSLCRWERDTPSNNLGRCIGGDALFLKTPEFIFSEYKNDLERLGVYLAICLIYRRYDLISTTLKLFKLEDSGEYSVFTKLCRILRRRLNLADRISRIANHVIGFSVSNADGSKIFY